MSLLETIEKARGRIQSGSLKNEQQVILAIIMPVLRDLGWDTTEPEQVFPEFTIGTGRVDYALLGANGTPLVLIEAKAHHRIRESSIDQLFRYAYGAGAGIIVLTDGQEWQLYLAQKTGVVAGDRLFCHLDLSKTSTETCEKALYRYLSRDNVLEHKAFRYANVDFDERVQAAEKEKQEKRDRDKLRATLPNIWKELKQDQTSPLYELMSRAVAKTGLKEYPEVLAEFISQLGPGQAVYTGASTLQRPQSTHVSEQPTPISPKMDNSTKEPKSKIVGYTLYGEKYDTRNNPGTLQTIFCEFMSRDPEFVPKLEQARPKWFTDARRFIAETPEKLYRNPNSRRGRKMDNGHYIDLNLGTSNIKERVEEGCKILGIQYGVDLILHEVLKSSSPQKSLVGYTLDDVRFDIRGVVGVLPQVFNEFMARDSEFESKLRLKKPKWFSDKRQFIADSPEALFPNPTDHQPNYRQHGWKKLGNGRYISTHMGSDQAKRRIEAGCEIVGIRYGIDLILHEQ